MNIKTHTKQIITEVYTYETTDGEIYDDYKSAEDHQMRIDGNRVTCDKCNGSKGHRDDPWCDWGSTSSSGTVWIPCKKCSGKGYLDKKVIFK